jgi:uncharacterized protein YihD (DUF1040 family)
MRDPKRIKRILDKIQVCWEKYPDFRLGQLILNAIQNDNFLYYIEDTDLEEAIDRFSEALSKSGLPLD